MQLLLEWYYDYISYYPQLSRTTVLTKFSLVLVQICTSVSACSCTSISPCVWEWTCILMLQMGMVGCVCISDSAWVCLWCLRCGEHVGVSASVCLWVTKHMCVADVRSRLCCMESDRYRLTVLFLKTFFRSWALSVKLQGRTQRGTVLRHRHHYAHNGRLFSLPTEERSN